MIDEITKPLLSGLENIVKIQEYILKSINEGRDESKDESLKRAGNIVSRVITGLIVTLLIASFTWIGDLLYEAPSPTQQKVIERMSNQIKDSPSPHASNQSHLVE